MAFLNKVILTLLIIITTFFSAFFLYPFIEPASWFYEINGVDVSHHQGVINWHRLAKDNVDFAYLKSTEGGDFVDPLFKQNWMNSKAANIPRGAYHFFTPCRSCRIQAMNFIHTVLLEKNALPPVVDAEHMGTCTLASPYSDMVTELEVFISTIESYYDKKPIIYTTHDFYTKHGLEIFSNNKLWLRSLFIPPTFGDQDWIIWQYHNRGRRDGINVPVDLNVLSGSLNQF